MCKTKVVHLNSTALLQFPQTIYFFYSTDSQLQHSIQTTLNYQYFTIIDYFENFKTVLQNKICSMYALLQKQLIYYINSFLYRERLIYLITIYSIFLKSILKKYTDILVCYDMEGPTYLYFILTTKENVYIFLNINTN